MSTETNSPPESSADFPCLGNLPANVFAQVYAVKMERTRAGKDVIDLGMGNPDIGTPDRIVAEMVAHASDHKNHRYSASRGIYGLRDAMAEDYARRHDVQVDSKTEVAVTIGAKEGIAHLMLAILGAGDTLIVPSPAYPIHSTGPRETYRRRAGGGAARSRLGRAAAALHHVPVGADARPVRPDELGVVRAFPAARGEGHVRFAPIADEARLHEAGGRITAALRRGP